MSNILRKRKWLFIMVLLVSMLATTVFSIVGFANANKNTVYAAGLADNAVLASIEQQRKEIFGENYEKSTALTTGQKLDSGVYHLTQDLTSGTSDWETRVSINAGQKVYIDVNGHMLGGVGVTGILLREGAEVYLFDSSNKDGISGTGYVRK